MPSLFDASSLLNLLVERGEKSIDLLRGNSVLDLTFYEAGNAIKTMYGQRKIGLEESGELIDIVAKLTPFLSVLPVTAMSLRKTLELAAGESITFYDAAYVFAAEKRKLDLVTDDEKLAKVARKYVKVLKSNDVR